MRSWVAGIAGALLCAVVAYAGPSDPDRELIGFTPGQGVGLGFAKMNSRCEEHFGAGVRMCTKKQANRTVNPPVLPAGDLAWVKGEPKTTASDITVSSKKAAEERTATAPNTPRCRGWNEGGWTGVILKPNGRFADLPCWKQARTACCALK